MHSREVLGGRVWQSGAARPGRQQHGLVLVISTEFHEILKASQEWMSVDASCALDD